MFANEETETQKKKKFFGKASVNTIDEPGTGEYDTNEFISVWNVTTSITLPYQVQGKYSGTINWGDGTTSINRYSNRTHIYDTPGIYIITIIGTVTGWSFGATGNGTNRNNILEIIRWGSLRGLNNSNLQMFSQCSNLTLNNTEDTPDLVGITSLQSMFIFCISLTQINNLENWDVSSVTNMKQVFAECSLFNGNVSNWNVSNVIDMELMFYNTSFNQNISSWDVSNVISMSGMFLEASSFNQPITNWNVSNVTFMQNMFSEATNFNQNINNWNVSGVTNMSGMFYYASNFNQDIGNWNVSSVIDMTYMFNNASSFNQDLSGWCVTSIPSLPTDFDTGASSWTGGTATRPQWGTCSP